MLQLNVMNLIPKHSNSSANRAPIVTGFSNGQQIPVLSKITAIVRGSLRYVPETPGNEQIVDSAQYRRVLVSAGSH